MDRLTDIRIQVHWIHEIDIWILLTQIFHCSYHTNKAIAKILTTMTCNEHKLFIMIQSRNIVTSLKKDTFLFLSKSCIILKFLNNHMKSVNYSVARNIYFALNFLIDEIFFRKEASEKSCKKKSYRLFGDSFPLAKGCIYRGCEVLLLRVLQESVRKMKQVHQPWML